MSHLFNFHEGSGFFKFMRKFSGSIPIYYPWIQAPLFVAEGMAMFAETELTQFGRMRTPEYKIMIREISKNSNIPSYRKIYSSYMHWPGPQAVYLYGAMFLDFLKKKYGEDKLKQIVKSYGRSPITLFTSIRFNQVYKKKLKTLWNEFRKSIKYEKTNKVEYLTKRGGFRKYPTLINNKIFYFHKNPLSFPTLREIDLKTKKDRIIKKIYNINSMSIYKPENKIYFSSINHFKTYYTYSDIYEYDIRKNKTKRITKGKRLTFPIRFKDEILCIKRIKSKSYLISFDLKTKESTILSKAFNNISFLNLSPDKTHILAAIKRKNNNWEIGLFNTRGELIKIYSTGLKKSFAPVWFDNETFYFITEFEDDYRLAKLNINTDEFYVYNDRDFPSIRYFQIINKNKIIASVFDYNGFNLILSELKDSLFNNQAIKVIKEIKDKEVKNKISHKIYRYNSIRDMIPKYSSILFRGNKGDYQPGFFISGNDAINRNYYDLSLYYSDVSDRINTEFNYIFSGFFPDLSFNFSDITDYYTSKDSNSFLYNEKNYKLSLSLPLIRKFKYSLLFYSDIHFKNTSEADLDKIKYEEEEFNGISFGLFFDSSKIYYDSISNNDGIKLGISYSRELKALGSNYNINSFLLDFRTYLSLKKPNVIAFRFNYANSWGEAGYLTYMGGNISKYGFQLAGNNPFNLLRGFSEGYFLGKEGFILNTEYRKSLFKIEYPISFVRLERVFASLFFDAGDIWIERRPIDLKYSMGFEITTVVKIIGYRFNFVIGIAKPIKPSKETLIYYRIGKSF